MVTVRTKIGIEESARQERVERVGGITATNVQKALETLDTNVTTLQTTQGKRNQRSVTGVGDLPITANDSILNINLSAPLVITVPLSTTRNGVPLTFKDKGKNFSSNNVTLNRSGAETFDGLTSVTLNIDGMEFTLTPYNDGVNTGYAIG